MIIDVQVVTWGYNVWNARGLPAFLFWWSHDNV